MRRISEQDLRVGSYIVIVVGLCLFGSWLTFIFGTKMANFTLHTFHLQEEKLVIRIISYQKPAMYTWFPGVTFKLGSSASRTGQSIFAPARFRV